MSASLSSLKPTWHVVLPWLDQLAPEQLLALQRMGGPAQWWLQETPQETSARRPYMDDVFDLLASFLGWGSGPMLDEQPLYLLLPFLPRDMSTTQLELDAKELEVLQAAGGETLGEVGRLTPLNIAYLAKVRLEAKREILAALVRAAALHPQGNQAHTSPLAPAEPPPSSTAPDHAIPGWFIGLDARAQDLITLHLCAPSPLPIDELAVRCRTMPPFMMRLRDELPQQLQNAALNSPPLASALKLFDGATQTPITRSDLIDHHPWLAARLPSSEVRVLELLLALHWSGSSDGDWLFSGSLAHARKLTRNALALESGESLSLAATWQLLEGTGRPLKATEQWLRYCGLRVVGQNQVELDIAVPSAPDHVRAPAVAGDYVLAPPRPATEAAPRDEARTTSPGPTHNHALSDPTPSHDAMVDVADVLEQLRTFAYAHRPGEPLADLLREAEELPEPLRSLLARTLEAVAGADRWELPDDDAPADDATANGADISGADNGVRRGALTDLAFTVLHEAGHPLEGQLLVERLGPGLNIRALKAQLPRDPRFVRSDVNAWALTEWGLRPYTTIKELIAQEVDLAGGSIPTDELVAILTREFTIAASSVRVNASSPPFTTRGGVVRRLSDVRRKEKTGQEAANGSVSLDDEGPSSDDLINLMGL
ncbi:hypothetical protein ACWET9_42755 [Streptomyces sp. NPDC004059]